MARPALTKTAQSPKITVIRQIAAKTAATARRYFGEIGRAQPSPNTALAMRDDMERSLSQIIKAELQRSGLPVVSVNEPKPEGDHWLFEAVSGRRNVLHGRLPFSTSFAYVKADGTCDIGAVYFPLEDVMVVAEAGLGSAGTTNSMGDSPMARGRMRVAGRTDIADSMLALPWATADVIALKLMEKAEDQKMHTRKTGHTLFDVIDVAAGRADALVATRLNRIEALLAPLILTESGAFATDTAGQPLTPASTTLVAANAKIHGQLLKAIR